MPLIKAKSESFETDEVEHPMLRNPNQDLNRLTHSPVAFTLPRVPAVRDNSLYFSALEFDADEHRRTVVQHGIRAYQDSALAVNTDKNCRDELRGILRYLKH